MKDTFCPPITSIPRVNCKTINITDGTEEINGKNLECISGCECYVYLFIYFDFQKYRDIDEVKL